jgi:Viral BACON domain
VWSHIRKSSGIALVFLLGMCTVPEVWALTVSPTALTFQAVQGAGNPASQSVNVSKTNAKTASWTASDSAAWLSVSPVTGSITNATQVTVSVNTAGLAPGTYSATVAVTVYKGGSVSIPVSLTVAASPSSSLTTTGSTSATASLSWGPSTSIVAGYKVYVGTTSGVYGPPIAVGNVTSYVVNNLAAGTYYFVVTDYDSSGVESPPSNEVSKIIY